jgi:hypothetical protein
MIEGEMNREENIGFRRLTKMMIFCNIVSPITQVIAWKIYNTTFSNDIPAEKPSDEPACDVS